MSLASGADDLPSCVTCHGTLPGILKVPPRSVPRWLCQCSAVNLADPQLVKQVDSLKAWLLVVKYIVTYVLLIVTCISILPLTKKNI